jgi:two-component system, NarL family, response regulator
MTPAAPIRILAADDHLVVRMGLVALIDRQEDMKVVGQAASGRQVVELYRVHKPDVTLMDLRMPGGSGVEAIEAICKEFPKARIIVITIHSGDEAVFQALRAGAQGYLLKDTPGPEILAAIRSVHAGQPCIPPQIAAAMAERLRQPELSAREIAILKLIARGFSNKRIADELEVSASTVKNHVASLMSKLGADDRAHAVTLALERNIIDLEGLRLR